jgi:hypothetical protein
VLRALHLFDFAHLRLDVAVLEAAVDDAQTAFFGLDDRHRRACDRVHVGRHEGAFQIDPRRKAAGQIDGRRIAPIQHAELRPEQEIVEGASAHGIDKAFDCWRHAVILEGVRSVDARDATPAPFRRR